ncbi:MAG: heavy-metal-associated domain-containing protein [Acidobacteria bacterium]|nr:heavy-metal-associated domain-containing protein [Acidobacteriota bacterium]
MRFAPIVLLGESRTTDSLRLGHRASCSPIWGRAFAACALLTASPLAAEFLAVRLEVSDMDCASCAQSLESGLKRIRGVEKVTLSQQNGAEMILQPGNKLTLERLRDAIKGVGFTPKTAHVKVKGTPVTDAGQWRFTVELTGQQFNLTASGADTLKTLQQNSGKIIVVDAIAPVPPDPRTTPSLDVRAISSGK